MRPQNPPLSKNNHIYKSSNILKKLSHQNPISSNMIDSKTKLHSARSQQLLRSTSQRPHNLPTTNKQLPTNNNKQLPQPLQNPFIGLKSTENLRPANKIQEKAYTFQNEDDYIGEWVYDQTQNKQKPHGYGCYKFKKQRLQYRGYFKQGLIHGSGTLHRLLNRGKPQIIYEGEWANGQKNGHGRYYYDQNVFYEGSWNKNRKQGQGKFKSIEGDYDGLWLNDKKHGRGILTMNNGTVYEGEWEKDELVTGEIRYSNGDVYRGQVNERFERHLHGEYVLGSGEESYKGTWRNNRKQGQGEILYGGNGERYIGQMRGDNRQGNNCTYEWKNGARVMCSFENNYPVRGKLILGDNSSFDFDCGQQQQKEVRG